MSILLSNYTARRNVAFVGALSRLDTLPSLHDVEWSAHVS